MAKCEAMVRTINVLAYSYLNEAGCGAVVSFCFGGHASFKRLHRCL